MTAENVTLVQSFQEYFEVVFAKSEEQKSKAYGIRYRVYCDEFEYEPIDQFPDKEEKDEYDDYSLHCIIIHKKTRKPAACVRLVSVYMDQGKETPLPFEKHCPESIDSDFVSGLHLNRQSVCEISRLAVDGLFRRRLGEQVTRFGELDGLSFTKHEERTFSLIAVAAFLAATALTELSLKTNVFAMMEPFLPRLLKRSGIIFKKAGVNIDYKGIRAPYFIQTQSALDRMNGDLKELYAWILIQIKATY